MFCADCGERIALPGACELHGDGCPEYGLLWTYWAALGAQQLAMLFTPLPDDLWATYLSVMEASPYTPMWTVWVESALATYGPNPQ